MRGIASLIGLTLLACVFTGEGLSAPEDRPDFRLEPQSIQKRQARTLHSRRTTRGKTRVHARRDNLRPQLSRLPASLRTRIAYIEKKWGPVKVVSVCRPGATFVQGGVRHPSWHAQCRAVDFEPPAKHRNAVLAYVRKTAPGYVLVYGWSRHIHLDNAKEGKYASKTKTWPRTIAPIKVARVPLPRPRPVLASDFAVMDAEVTPAALYTLPEPESKPVPLPIRPDDAKNIFARFEASLFKTVGVCRDFAGLDWRVKKIVADSVKYFGKGPALMSSCYRDLVHNKRVNGAKRSQHLAKRAIDYKIAGVDKFTLFAWLKKHPLAGGVGVYRSSAVHVDVRPRHAGLVTTWNWNAKTKWAAVKRWSKKRWAAYKKRLKKKRHHV